MINVADVNQWCWLEESGQWLENVIWTHLVLASGKQVLQKQVVTNSASNSCSKFESLISVPTIQPRKKQRTGRFSRKLQQDNSINFMSTPILFFGLLAKCKNKERNFIIKRHCCSQGQGRWQFF